MNILKRDSDYSTADFVKYGGVLLTELAENITALHNAAVKAGEAAAVAGEARKDANEESGEVWNNVKAIAETVQKTTADAGSVVLTLALFDMALQEATRGSDAAVRSVRSYASTGRKVIEAVADGRLTWAAVAGHESYAATRTALKSEEKQAIDTARGELNKLILSIARNKSASQAVADIRALIEAAKPMELAAAASREDSKKAAQAAREADNIRQSQPAAPAITETAALRAAVH